jgi:hypothetical protein
MFLDTAAEALSIPGPQREFKNYWSSFAAANPPVVLPMQRSMEKLNRARVDLKHHGIRPADDQLEEYVILSQAFVDEACRKCFDMDLTEASMFDLIKDDQVRDLLKTAQAELQHGNLGEAFVTAAKGLSCGFSAGSRSKLASRFSHFSLQNAVSDPLRRAISDVVTDISQEISLLSLGIDLRRYEKFLTLTPTIHRSANDTFSVIWQQSPNTNKEDAQWCIDFVVDFMLRAEQV